MKKLIFAALLFISVSVSAQNVKVDGNGNYVAVKQEQKDSEAKATGKTFTDSKGQTFPVYISKNGKLFVIRTSQKTDSQYKQYLKL